MLLQATACFIRCLLQAVACLSNLGELTLMLKNTLSNTQNHVEQVFGELYFKGKIEGLKEAQKIISTSNVSKHVKLMLNARVEQELSR